MLENRISKSIQTRLSKTDLRVKRVSIVRVGSQLNQGSTIERKKPYAPEHRTKNVRTALSRRQKKLDARLCSAPQRGQDGNTDATVSLMVCETFEHILIVVWGCFRYFGWRGGV